MKQHLAWAIRLDQHHFEGTQYIGIFYVPPYTVAPRQAGCTTALFATRRAAREYLDLIRLDWYGRKLHRRSKVVRVTVTIDERR